MNAQTCKTHVFLLAFILSTILYPIKRAALRSPNVRIAHCPACELKCLIAYTIQRPYGIIRHWQHCSIYSAATRLPVECCSNRHTVPFVWRPMLCFPNAFVYAIIKFSSLPVDLRIGHGFLFLHHYEFSRRYYCACCSRPCRCKRIDTNHSAASLRIISINWRINIAVENRSERGRML